MSPFSSGSSSAQSLWSKIALLLLMANLVYGIAAACLLPPFEGIDETAHFSRIQSQAFTPQLSGNAVPEEKAGLINQRITADVYDYYRRGPMPYLWIFAKPLHMYDPRYSTSDDYITYRTFFDQPQMVEEYGAHYRATPLLSSYRPGPEFNWQYQHPALYYMVMAPVMTAFAGHASLTTIILIMRIVSYGMAFFGFCIALLATRRHLILTGIENADKIVALGALYPFLMPMYAWEFARLGNDSICLLLFSFIWSFTLWHIRAPRSDAWIYIGFIMGLSLLAKAFMIPAAVGILLFLACYHFVVIRKAPGHERDWWMAPLKVLGLLLLTGGPTYLHGLVASGDFGSTEFRTAFHTSGAVDILLQRFSLLTYADGVYRIYQSLVWLFGTWSALVVDMPIYTVLNIVTGMIGAFYLVTLRQTRRPILFLPLFLIPPLFACLMAHLLATIVLWNQIATPGYYMHILAPAFALIYGVGLNRCLSLRWGRAIMGLLATIIVAFDFFIPVMEATVFAGCSVPTLKGYYLRLSPSAIVTCKPSLILQRLDLLAHGSFALGGFVLALALIVIAGVMILRQRTISEPNESDLAFVDSALDR